jgi:hypothetical protein
LDVIFEKIEVRSQIWNLISLISCANLSHEDDWLGVTVFTPHTFVRPWELWSASVDCTLLAAYGQQHGQSPQSCPCDKCAEGLSRGSVCCSGRAPSGSKMSKTEPGRRWGGRQEEEEKGVPGRVCKKL